MPCPNSIWIVELVFPGGQLVPFSIETISDVKWNTMGQMFADWQKVGDQQVVCVKSPMFVDLSRWMNRLFHPLEAGHRQQIRDRAAKQKKEMTIKSVQKSTQKRQVHFGWNFISYILILV